MAVWVHTETSEKGWLPHLLGEGLQLIFGVDILPDALHGIAVPTTPYSSEPGNLVTLGKAECSVRDGEAELGRVHPVLLKATLGVVRWPTSGCGASGYG
jgi:hypothetical protein